MSKYLYDIEDWLGLDRKGMVQKGFAPVDAAFQELGAKPGMVSGAINRYWDWDDKLYRHNLEKALKKQGPLPKKRSRSYPSIKPKPKTRKASAPKQKQQMPPKKYKRGRRFTRRDIRRRVGRRVHTGHYVTRGHGPRKFATSRRMVIPKAVKYGIMKQDEDGGVITDANRVYVGHATCAPNDYLFLMAASIVRWLYDKADVQFTRWDDIDPVDHRFVVGYRRTLNSPEEETTAFSASGLTYAAIAQQVLDEMKGVMQQTQDGIDWTALNTTFTTFGMLFGAGTPIARLPANDATFILSVKSVLRVQNRTLADHDDVGGTADEQAKARATDHVENNPLVGYKYRVKGKGFLVREAAFNAVTQLNTVGAGYGANNDTGLITNDGFATNDSDKPLPPSSFQGCRKAARITLNPGGIGSDTISHVFKMKLNSFVQRFAATYITDNPGYIRDFKWYGYSSMVGLESALNSRQSTEQQISIAYEMNRTSYAYLKVIPSRISMPFVQVDENEAVQFGPVPATDPLP